MIFHKWYVVRYNIIRYKIVTTGLMGKGMYAYYTFFICSRGTTDALQKIPFAGKACKIVFWVTSFQEDFAYFYFVLNLNHWFWQHWIIEGNYFMKEFESIFTNQDLLVWSNNKDCTAGQWQAFGVHFIGIHHAIGVGNWAVRIGNDWIRKGIQLVVSLDVLNPTYQN